MRGRRSSLPPDICCTASSAERYSRGRGVWDGRPGEGIGARLFDWEELLEVRWMFARAGSRSRSRSRPRASEPKTSERGGSRLLVCVAGSWCMWEVAPRVGLWLTTWRVNGCGW